MMPTVPVQAAFSGYRVVIWFAVTLLSLLAVLYLLQPVLVYLLIALILYALFEPLTAALIRRGISQGVSALLVTALVCILFVVVILSLLPRITVQFEQILQQLPQALSALRQKLDVFMLQWGVDDAGAVMDRAIDQVQGQAGEIALVHGSNLAVTLLSVIVLVPFIAFFLFRDFRHFRNWAFSRLPNASFELVCLIYYRIVEKLQTYVRGVILQSSIVALVCAIGFYLAGFESFILLAVLAGLFNIIPYVGPLLAMVLPVLISISTVPVDTVMLLTGIATVLVAQLIDNLLVIPVVIANSVDMHPLVVMLGLVIFGSLMGPLGMILAVPVMVTIGLIYSGLENGLRH